MNRDEAFYAETLFDKLEKYKSPKFHQSVKELRDIFQPIIDNERTKEAREKHLDKYSYGKFTPRKRVAQVAGTISSAISFYEEAYTNVDKLNKSQQDLLHKIELLDATEEELLQSAKDLQELQTIRRESKDFVELMGEFYKVAKQIEEAGYLKKLYQVVTDIDETIKRMENRSYKVREKTALAEAFEKAESKIASNLVSV
jgi:hypothetical protein